MDLEDNYMFPCPACRQHISDSQIHDHIQNCELYSHHSSHSDSYSPFNSSYENSYRYVQSSITSSESESLEETGSADFSSKNNQTTPSKTHSIATCPVCFCNYHNTRHPPLLLPNCGHTVCKPCLKDIKKKSDKITCPTCREPSKLELKSLPINYALLDLTEKKASAKCPWHDYEFVAYCSLDDSILCGACLFDHKDHTCCLLNDSQLEKITKQKKNQVKKKIEDLSKTKEIWTLYLREIEKKVQIINENIERHKICLSETEKKMTKTIQEGSKKCVQELAELATHESLKRLQNTFSLSISLLDQQISMLENKIDQFDELSMAEKLDNEPIPNKEPLVEVPSLAAAKTLLEKLSISVDYKQAIQNQKIF
ncbi:hypothetical protein SteCoe_9952 [Stentor coeruleus]|uniref:RING-type domain-containing protein n=1 Tax=Stentor coeruleus TaxID=5963 RepID=A0A1R2CGK2_9CILI|nr:hypothetical protein SteCoe_9952 [Stentor coeruleus]